MQQKHRMIMGLIAVVIALAACLVLANLPGGSAARPAAAEETESGETEADDGSNYTFDDETDEADEDETPSAEELGLIAMSKPEDTEEVELDEEDDTPVDLPDESLVQGLHDGPESEYYYNFLTDEEKETYDLLLAAIRNMETGEVNVTITDTERIQNIINYILLDDPSLFWYDHYGYTTYSFGDEIVRVSVQFTYNCDEAERDRRQALIDTETEAILAAAPQGDDYERIRYVYEHIVRNTEYNIDSPDNQNICSVFLDHASVCHGYALSAQYLLNRMGIECVSVSGDAPGPHTWNVVWADGEPYYMDVTWGDPCDNTGAGGSDADPENLSYNYLLLTGEETEREHTAYDIFPMPDCTATADNYYVREGLYLESWDPAAFTEIANRYFSNGDYSFEIKFADRASFEEAYNALITNNGAWSLTEQLPGWDGLSTYWYTPGSADDAAIYAITFEFE